jgi:hypothetical protein
MCVETEAYREGCTWSKIQNSTHCIFTRTRTYMQLYTHTHTHIHIYTHIHTHIHTHTCTYAHTCKHLHTHTNSKSVMPRGRPWSSHSRRCRNYSSCTFFAAMFHLDIRNERLKRKREHMHASVCVRALRTYVCECVCVCMRVFLCVFLSTGG